MATDITTAQQTFMQHLEFLSSGRTREWTELFTPDGVLEFPYAPAGYPTRLVGRAELGAHMESFLLSFEVTFDNVVFHDMADPTMVIAELQGHGTYLPTGERYEQAYISVLRTAGSLIASYVDYWNPLAMPGTTRSATAGPPA